MSPPFRISVPTPFPSQVVGQNGVRISKANGIWSVTPDFTQVPVIEPPGLTSQALLYNPATGQYQASSIGSIAPAQPIYMTPILAAMGDANVNRGIWTTFPNNEDVCLGTTFWASFLSGYRIFAPVLNNFSHPNDATVDMIAQIPNVIATNADTCIVWGGLRDLLLNVPVGPEATTGTITSNLRYIYRTLITAGVTVIAVTVLPSSGWTSAQIKQVHYLNSWIREQNNQRAGLHVVDADVLISDPASATYLGKSGTIATNLVNPSTYGAYIIGNQIANIIKTLTPDQQGVTFSQDDFYDAVNNPSGALNANPLATGTGGSLLGTVTGSVATNWFVDNSNSGGATVTASKITLPDGRTAQRVVISGTYISNNARKTIDLGPGAISPSLASPGDILEGSGYVSVAAGSVNLNCAPIWMNSTESGTNYQNYTNETAIEVGDFYASEATTGNVAVAGNLFVPRHTVTATPTILKIQCRINLRAINSGAAQPCSATIDFTSVALRKVPQTLP